MFPEKANVSLRLRFLRATTQGLRVWERGVGITEACGSAACATLVAAVRDDLWTAAGTRAPSGRRPHHRMARGRTAMS